MTNRMELIRALEKVLANPDPFQPVENQLAAAVFATLPNLETNPDILAQAKANFAEMRSLLRRPTWEELKVNDPIHMRMREGAIQTAREQFRVWAAAQDAAGEPFEGSACPICGDDCVLNESDAT